MEGVTGPDPKKIKIQRIASGLAEPLGMEVVDGEIYVLQKHELTKLIDHDGDGVMDEYKVICDGWGVRAWFIKRNIFILLYQWPCDYCPPKGSFRIEGEH